MEDTFDGLLSLRISFCVSLFENKLSFLNNFSPQKAYVLTITKKSWNYIFIKLHTFRPLLHWNLSSTPCCHVS